MCSNKPSSSVSTEVASDIRPASEDTSGLSASASLQGDNYTVLSEKVVTERKVVINELLFFVNNAYDCQARSVIHKTIVDFYREEEIFTAKSTLCQYVESSQGASIHPYIKKRIGENKIDRSVEDMLNIFVHLDESGNRDSLPTFCAASLSRIPMLPDEVSDLAAIRKDRVHIKKTMHSIKDNMSDRDANAYAS